VLVGASGDVSSLAVKRHGEFIMFGDEFRSVWQGAPQGSVDFHAPAEDFYVPDLPKRLVKVSSAQQAWESFGKALTSTRRLTSTGKVVASIGSAFSGASYAAKSLLLLVTERQETFSPLMGGLAVNCWLVGQDNTAGSKVLLDACRATGGSVYPLSTSTGWFGFGKQSELTALGDERNRLRSSLDHSVVLSVPTRCSDLAATCRFQVEVPAMGLLTVVNGTRRDLSQHVTAQMKSVEAGFAAAKKEQTSELAVRFEKGGMEEASHFVDRDVGPALQKYVDELKGVEAKGVALGDEVKRCREAMAASIPEFKKELLATCRAKQEAADKARLAQVQEEIRKMQFAKAGKALTQLRDGSLDQQTMEEVKATLMLAWFDKIVRQAKGGSSDSGSDDLDEYRRYVAGDPGRIAEVDMVQLWSQAQLCVRSGEDRKAREFYGQWRTAFDKLSPDKQNEVVLDERLGYDPAKASMFLIQYTLANNFIADESDLTVIDELKRLQKQRPNGLVEETATPKPNWLDDMATKDAGKIGELDGLLNRNEEAEKRLGELKAEKKRRDAIQGLVVEWLLHAPPTAGETPVEVTMQERVVLAGRKRLRPGFAVAAFNRTEVPSAASADSKKRSAFLRCRAILNGAFSASTVEKDYQAILKTPFPGGALPRSLVALGRCRRIGVLTTFISTLGDVDTTWDGDADKTPPGPKSLPSKGQDVGERLVDYLQKTDKQFAGRHGGEPMSPVFQAGQPGAPATMSPEARLVFPLETKDYGFGVRVDPEFVLRAFLEPDQTGAGTPDTGGSPQGEPEVRASSSPRGLALKDIVLLPARTPSDPYCYAVLVKFGKDRIVRLLVTDTPTPSIQAWLDGKRSEWFKKGSASARADKQGRERMDEVLNLRVVSEFEALEKERDYEFVVGLLAEFLNGQDLEKFFSNARPEDRKCLYTWLPDTLLPALENAVMLLPKHGGPEATQGTELKRLAIIKLDRVRAPGESLYRLKVNKALSTVHESKYATAGEFLMEAYKREKWDTGTAAVRDSKAPDVFRVESALVSPAREYDENTGRLGVVKVGTDAKYLMVVSGVIHLETEFSRAKDVSPP
jgi:hypothetical protein